MIEQEYLALLEIAEAKAIQHIFARSIAPSRLVLKGGLAMRLVYGSSRATQDIDLNADPSLSGPALEKAMDRSIRNVLMDLKTAGVITGGGYTKPKNTTTTSRWKVSCTLPRNRELHFKIEVSRRKMDRGIRSVQQATKPVSLGKIQIPSVLVPVYDRNTLAASKTVALLADNRDKVRDVYDLYILIQGEVDPGPALSMWMKNQKKNGCPEEALIEKLYAKLESMDYDKARTDLLPFIDSGVRQYIDRDTWEGMRLEVGEAVASWIKESGRSVGFQDDVGPCVSPQ